MTEIFSEEEDVALSAGIEEQEKEKRRKMITAMRSKG